MNRLSDVRNDKTRLNTMQAQMETRLTEIEESGGALQEQEAALREALTAVESNWKQKISISSSVRRSWRRRGKRRMRRIPRMPICARMSKSNPPICRRRRAVITS